MKPVISKKTMWSCKKGKTEVFADTPEKAHKKIVNKIKSDIAKKTQLKRYKDALLFFEKKYYIIKNEIDLLKETAGGLEVENELLKTELNKSNEVIDDLKLEFKKINADFLNRIKSHKKKEESHRIRIRDDLIDALTIENKRLKSILGLN